MPAIEFPQEVIDRLANVMKEKLPTPVDDAIIYDIIHTHIAIAGEYVNSLEKTTKT